MNQISYVFQDSRLLKMSILDNVRIGKPDATDQEVLQALKDAPIILMYEATASLDVDNESLIQEALSKLIQNKTVMIIAHRMRTVDGVDKIVVLKDGVVAESGTPEELKAQNGIYKHMINLQLQAENWSIKGLNEPLSFHPNIHSRFFQLRWNQTECRHFSYNASSP